MNRSQPPISTARANPVSVPIPRRQHSLATTGDHGEPAAIAPIARSSRVRRASAATTASEQASHAACSAGRSQRRVLIHARCITLPLRPPSRTRP